MIELATLRGKSVTLGFRGECGANPFVVDSAIDDTAVLRPTSAESKTFAGQLTAGDFLTVGAAASNGFVTADVVVQRWTPASRLLLVSNPPSLNHVQRRAFRRVPMAFAAELTVERGGRLVARPAEGIDLSLGGMAILMLGEPLTPGEPLAAVLRLGGEAVVTTADVVGSAPTGRANWHKVRAGFTQIHATQRPVLAMALHETELARARVAGEQ